MLRTLARLTTTAVFTILSLCAADVVVSKITTIKDPGGRVDWSWPRNLIAYDSAGSNAHYDVYTMRPDGTDARCLTCNNPQLPATHKGNPSWHPSGNWIVFQVQKVNRAMRPQMQKMMDMRGSPGIGVNNDLWVMDATGAKLSLLHEVALRSGALHPEFSPSGKYLLWGELIELGGGNGLGREELKVAEFHADGGTPRLDDIQTFRPGNKTFYESHGWSPDDRKIYFTASPDRGGDDYFMDVFSYDLQSQQLVNLTDSPEDWDELPTPSPDGSKILWMSTKGNPAPGRGRRTIADFWIMNADGSGKKRLTFFNAPGHPESSATPLSCADAAWSEDGKSIVALLNRNPMQYDSAIVRIDLVVR